MHYLDLIASGAVILFAVFAISALFALGLGATVFRAGAIEDEAMRAYLGLDDDGDDDPFDDAARTWVADMREAA